MALPTKGDRLTAKVRLTFYTDAECKNAFPPVPPMIGYKDSFQVMERFAGEEVGTYTGVKSEVGFQVDWVQQYRHVPAWPKKPQNIVMSRTSYVKISEVTGNWDKGVDAPVVVVPEVVTAETDNTNTLLGLAVAGAAFMKFVLPQFRN